MLKAFYSSATGMRAQEMLIDNTANNLANVNTVGFKKRHITFADLIYDTDIDPGAAEVNGQFRPVGLQIGTGVKGVATTSVFSQGTPTESRIPTHISIEGEGFFRVTKGNITAYTRDGSFTPDANGQLTNGNGYALDPQVVIPNQATNISISPAGIVSYELGGARATGPTIQLARFTNPAGLRSIGDNLLTATDASGAETLGNPEEQGLGGLRQGFLEGANVEVVSELVSLITAQRAYEINSRAIRAGDEMLSTASELVR